mmetsp:Transcript_14936/g.28233  ORF Transcript_14936/g.28233 Transcript_14936/m.28233 type:complete len:3070 (+) Transcript_14936:85-9294(+)
MSQGPGKLKNPFAAAAGKAGAKAGPKKKGFRLKSRPKSLKTPLGLGSLLGKGPPGMPSLRIQTPKDEEATDESKGRPSSGEITPTLKPRMLSKRRRPKKKKFSSIGVIDMKMIKETAPKESAAKESAPKDSAPKAKPKPPPPKKKGTHGKKAPPPPGYKFSDDSLFPEEAALPSDAKLSASLTAAINFQAKSLFAQRDWKEGELKELTSNIDAKLKTMPPLEAKKDPLVPTTVETRENWAALLAPDGSGLHYYLNNDTGELTWMKPDVFKTKAEKKTMNGEWYWVPHKLEGYVPAKKLSQSKSGMKVEHRNNKTEDIPKDSLPLVPVVWENMAMLERDMVMLPEMSRPIICWNLKERFLKDQIYTSIGTILISINPYRWLKGLYTPSVMEDFQKRRAQQGPHVYGIADNAFRAMRMHYKDQSIVISGESGAGKTECTKQCLAYLAEVAGSGDSNIEQKILRANPLLEAYGNAKTVRNNNSSRFGKYVEIFFNRSGKICGASTQNYLLEKSRVVSVGEEERNYHIFFQLCKGMTEEEKQHLRLSDPKDFKFLSKGKLEVKGIDDEKDFQEVCEAMGRLNMASEDIKRVFEITAGVLHLGNVDYSETKDKHDVQTSSINDANPVKHVSELLGLDEKKLAEALTTRLFKSRGAEAVVVPLSKKDAEQVRDAMAKHVYEFLFDWLVMRINQACKVEDEGKTKNSIGILDIFGFEIFKLNSFEQLCINYANEKLQQLFNNWTFKKEEELYESEGLKFKNVGYSDNQNVLDLIEKRREGLLDMIDEEIRMPRGSDKTYMQKIVQKHGKKKIFTQNRKVKMNFMIAHFAGEVSYSSEGFLFKNKDKLTEDLVALLGKSSHPLLREIIVGAEGSKDTLGKKFKKQLMTLMKTLNQTQPHYIRCIKPNPTKSPSSFYGEMVLLQLQYSGVFEAVKIRKSGFPFRHTHGNFYRRYACALGREYKWPEDERKSCEILLKHMKQRETAEIGRTRVLYRANEHRTMELYRNLAIEHTCLFLQRIYRGHMARKRKNELLKARPKLVQAMKTRTLKSIHEALELSDKLMYSQILEVSQVKAYKVILEEESRIMDGLVSLEDKDPEKAAEDYKRLFQASASIGYTLEMKEGTNDKDDVLIQWLQKGDERMKDAVERKKTRMMLQAGTRKVDKLMINTAFKMAEHLLELSKGEKYEFHLDKDDVKAANDMIAHIDKEEALLKSMCEAMTSGGYLKRGEKPDSEMLTKLCSEADGFGLLTRYGVDFLDKCKRIRDLRLALAVALGRRDSDSWGKVRKTLAHAQAAQAPPSVSDVEGVETKAPIITTLLKDYEECKFASVAQAHELECLEVEGRLSKAIAAVNQKDLVDTIREAEAMHKKGPCDFTEELYPPLKKARDLLKNIMDCLKDLKDHVEKRNQTGIEKMHKRANELDMEIALYEGMQESKVIYEKMLHCRERLRITSQDVWSPEGGKNIALAVNTTVELKFKHAPEMKEALTLQRKRMEDDRITQLCHAEMLRGGFLKEGDVINTTGLEEAIRSAKAFEMKTQAGKVALRMAINLLALRVGLNDAEETKDKEKWKLVETCISEAGGELGDYDEVKFGSERLANQRQRDAVEDDLYAMIKERNKPKMLSLRERAMELEMHDKWYAKLYPVMVESKEMLETIDKHLSNLTEVEQKREQAGLEKWIKAAHSLGLARGLYPELPLAESTLKDMIACREALAVATKGIFDDNGHARMDAAMKTCVDLKFEHAPELVEAKKMLHQLVIEEKLIKNLEDAMYAGGFLAEGDVVNLKEIDSANEALVKNGGVKTNEGRDAVARSAKVRELRTRISRAEGTKDKALWKEVEKHVSSAGSKLAEHPEFLFAGKRVAEQRGRDEIKIKLVEAVDQRNQADLRRWLKRAVELEMDKKYLSLYPEYTSSTEMLAKIDDHLSSLNKAAEFRDEAKIALWIEKAIDLKLDAKMYNDIPDAKGVLQRIVEIRNDLKVKIQNAFAPTGGVDLEASIKCADDFKYSHAPEMGAAKSTLATRKEDDRIAASLQAAMKEDGFLEDDGHEKIRTKTLHEFLEEAKKFEMKTAAGKNAETLGRRILNLRLAMRTAEKTKEVKNWDTVQTRLAESGEELSHHPEVTFAKDRLSAQRKREEAEAKLVEAVANGHQSNLTMWLKRSEDLEMNAKWYVDLYPIHATAATALSRIIMTSENLVKGEAERDQASLEENLKNADDLHMKDDMYPAIPAAKTTLKRMITCRNGLKEACEEIYEVHGHKKMDTAIRVAEDLKFMHAPEMKESKELLGFRIEDEKYEASLLKLTRDKGFSNRFELANMYKVDYAPLTEAIVKATEFKMRTGSGKSALLRAIVLRNLRQSLDNALNTKDAKLWAEVINRAREAVLIRGELANHPDVVGAVEEAKLARTLRVLERTLTVAIEKRDENTLEATLVEARAVGMHKKYVELFPVYKHAVYALTRIQRIRATIAEADAKRTQELYEKAIADGEAYEYDVRARTDEFKETKNTRQLIGQINMEAKDCVKMIEENHMKEVLQRARDLKMTTKNIEKIESYLENTSDEKLMQAQIRAATALQDMGRKVKISIRLKNWYLKKYKEQFELANFTKLRTPAGWAALKVFTMNREQLANGMLKHSKYDIHAAMTEMTHGVGNNAMARKMFKNLMGYMGDRQYQNPMALSEEICEVGLNNEDLRDELYLHCLKQLTDNESNNSRDKGWMHLSMLLHTFPPSGLDNFLDKWIHDNAGERREQLLDALYATLYTEKRHAPLSSNEVKKVLEGKNLKNFKYIQNDPKQSPVYTGYKLPKYIPPKHSDIFPDANKGDLNWAAMEPPAAKANQVGASPDVKALSAETPIEPAQSSIPSGFQMPDPPEAEDAPLKVPVSLGCNAVDSPPPSAPVPDTKNTLARDAPQAPPPGPAQGQDDLKEPPVEAPPPAPKEEETKTERTPQPQIESKPTAKSEESKTAVSTEAESKVDEAPKKEAEKTGETKGETSSKTFGDWEELKSAEGEPYYWNTVTDEVTWEMPEALKNAKATDGADDEAPITKSPIATSETDAASVWEECKTEEGELYYWNTETDETSWERPVGFK